MAMVGRLHPIDLALLPIGDNFTMGPEDALEAVHLIKPNLVIPMHYNTWPLIEQDPREFKQAVEAQTPARVIILAPGESYEV
jgi:L-ascorbate metabolism protein UlaG (beta-lactamase superfamily)